MVRRLVRLLAHQPILGVVLGLLVALGGAAFGWSSWQDVQAFADGPLSLSLDEAMAQAGDDDLYVSLTSGVVPACDSAATNDKTSYVPIHAGDGGIDVLAYYNDQRTCDSLGTAPLVGTLGAMNPRMRDRLVASGLALSAAPLAVCMYCGATNAKMGLGLAGFFVLAGLVLMPLGFAMAGQIRRGTAPPWLQ